MRDTLLPSLPIQFRIWKRDCCEARLMSVDCGIFSQRGEAGLGHDKQASLLVND